MKILYALTAAALLAGMLTGCGQNETESIAEENLPYGATLITDTEKGEVPITYDRRFFDADEIQTLSSYFYALESQNVELLEETTLDLYIDFIVDAMYQGLAGTDGLLTEMNAKFAVEENVPYTIQDVEITAFYTVEDNANTDLENLYNMLQELSGDENYLQRINGGKYLTYTIQTQSDGQTKTFTDQTLFLIQVDGVYVVCS